MRGGSRRCRLIMAGVLASLSLTGLSIAQDPVVPATNAAPKSENAAPAEGGMTLSTSVGAGYEFSSDIDHGGDFSMQRYGAEMHLKSPLSSALSMTHSLYYNYLSYDFSDAQPWDDVQTADYGLVLDYAIDRQWAVFGGPVLGYAGENGADVDKSITGGVMAGTRYSFSRELTLGLGLVATSRLEDNVAVLPVPIVYWHISEAMCLKTVHSQPGVPGVFGAELAWTPSSRWELAGGAMYSSSRFRLDDSGPADGGVGQNTGQPVFLRLGFSPSPAWQFSLTGGAVLGGELRLEDSHGHKLAQQDYDPAVFLGAAVTCRF